MFIKKETIIICMAFASRMQSLNNVSNDERLNHLSADSLERRRRQIRGSFSTAFV